MKAAVKARETYIIIDHEIIYQQPQQ